MSFIPAINNKFSTANSTTSLLGIGATFTGAWEDVSEYTAAGTGARTVRLIGLDDTGLEQEEDIILAGIVPVSSVNLFSRVFSMRVLTAGSTGENQGTLTVSHAVTTANVFIELGAGINRSTVAAYTIPSNKKGILMNYLVSITRTNGSAGSAIASLRVRPSGGVYEAIRYEQITTQAPFQPDLGGGIELAPNTDIKVRIESVSDNTTSASASFVILLIDN